MATHTFNAVFEDAGDGWVDADVPELPEVQTQGESLEQARKMVRDAIELVLEDRRARKEEIPSWLGYRRVGRSRCVKKRELERHLAFSRLSSGSAGSQARTVGEPQHGPAKHCAATS
jgi:predicted RNase H-like HicB family nuclease